MNNRAKNFVLSIAVFAGLLFVLELFFRFYLVESRIFFSNISRKNKINALASKILTTVREAGVSEKTFNIYYLGESTMWGVPYGQRAAIPNLTEYRLGERLGGRKIKSINLGSAAKDAVFARYMLELLFRKKEIFHPSLIVVYSGHNQFLKFHPAEPGFRRPVLVWFADHSELARQTLILISNLNGEALEMGRRHLLDRSIFPFDPHGYSEVIDNYKEQLASMVRLAENNQTPIIFSTLVSNYATWEPNRSVFYPRRGAPSHETQLVGAFERGLEAEKKKDYQTALAAYQEAEAICDSFAEIYFREGKVYEALGQYVEAWQAFQKAINYDAMPIRAVSAQNDFIRSLERFPQAYVVDSLTYLRSNSPNGLLDNYLIIDGVHPNFEGYLLMSEAIAQKIHSLFSTKGENLKPLGLDTAKEFFGVDRWKLVEVDCIVGKWMARLATWRYDPTERLASAEQFFREAVEIDPFSYEGFLGLSVVQFMKRDREKASQFLQKALAVNPEKTDKYFKVPWVRKIVRWSAGMNLSQP